MSKNAPTTGNSGFMKFMNTNLGGAAAGGIMDGIGSLFTIGAQKRAATTAYKRQKAFTKEVFDYTNAYNTPKAQMDRLRAAGLNPALMYGQGNVGNATAQTANVQKADVSGPNLAQSAAAGAQISLMNAQDEKLRAEADNIREQTVLTGNQSSKVLAEILNIEAQKAKTIQETLNLTTMGEVLKVDKAIKIMEKERAKKGTLKGDTIGNVLSILGLDPVNVPEHRSTIEKFLIAYFGARAAAPLISAIMGIWKKPGKGITINNKVPDGS